MEEPRWATVPPPEHLDSYCVSDILDTNHQNIFATTISNLLFTEITKQTFAQIINGLPLKNIVLNLRYTGYTIRNPIFAYIKLYPGIFLKKTRIF